MAKNTHEQTKQKFTKKKVHLQCIKCIAIVLLSHTREKIDDNIIF